MCLTATPLSATKIVKNDAREAAATNATAITIPVAPANGQVQGSHDTSNHVVAEAGKPQNKTTT